MQRIEADLMIPGRGEPVPDAVVVLDGVTIAYAGPAASAPETPGASVVTAHAVMPGMWDCHAHLLGVRSMDLALLPQVPAPLRAARATADLRAALDAAGAVISTTGGHGDLHGYPLPWMHDVRGELRLADGPAECAKAVREQLRRNAKVIKVCASGGVMSEVDHPIHQQFTVDELKAVVEVAGMAERVVAAHCHGKPGIMAALAAGVRTIEHGTFLDEEAAVAMRESGAILVTTRTIVQEILDSRAVPAYAMVKLEAIAERHAAAMTLAYEAGVTVAMGTDLAVTGRELPCSWGRNGRELPLLGKVGYPSLAAIEAATATGPATLGPQAPRSGQLLAGYDADVLTLDADPLADLAVLADPARITGVWRAGRRVKP